MKSLSAHKHSLAGACWYIHGAVFRPFAEQSKQTQSKPTTKEHIAWKGSTPKALLHLSLHHI